MGPVERNSPEEAQVAQVPQPEAPRAAVGIEQPAVPSPEAKAVQKTVAAAGQPAEDALVPAVGREKPIAPLREAKAIQQSVAAAVKEGAAADPPPQPAQPAECQECKRALGGGDYGTTVHFAKDPQEAAKLAKAENKLMVIFTISGNFEDSKFT
jgi:hypothetical protein